MQHIKYALDKLFLFMIILSIAIFILDMASLAGPDAIFAMHVLNIFILLGYVFFFVRDLSLAKSKINYCKEHWILATFLVLPVLGFTPVLPAKETLSLTQNIAWYLFDEAGML